MRWRLVGTRSDAGAEAGESLVELTVSVAILGIIGTVLIEMLLVMSSGTAVRRDVVEGQNQLASWADAVISGTYVACAQPASIPMPRSLAAAYTARVAAVEYWNGSAFVGQCEPATDQGLQLVTLEVTRHSGAGPTGPQQLGVVKRKPCESAC